MNVNGQEIPQSPTKKTPAQQQADLVRQIVTEFDIQTHVKKMTIEAMDSYMRNNKQAFEYIGVWENKFVNFEQRLSKAEIYYKNIEANINAKIEVTNSLDEKLSTFSQQFWEGMKQSAESLQQMRKNYINLVREAGNQANLLKNFEREQTQIHEKMERVDSKYEQEVEKVFIRINQIEANANVKDSERKKESFELLEKVSQAKSLMDSRIALMTEISKNLQLYKDEKTSINTRITQLYEELNRRVLQEDLNDLKRYIDNNSVLQQKRLNLQLESLSTQITDQTTIRKQSDSILQNKIKNLKQINEKQFEDIRKEEEEKHQLIMNKIKQMEKDVNDQFVKKESRIDQNTQRINSNYQLIGGIQKKLEIFDYSLENKDSRLVEVESNVMSINELIGKIEKENLQRTQEMEEIRVNAEEKGDLGEQIKGMTEKILSHDQFLRFLEQKVDQNSQFASSLSSELKQSLSCQQNELKELKIISEQKHLENKNKISTNHKEINQKMKCSNENMVKYVNDQIGDKIDSIREKFEFLEVISKEMKEFKQTFSQQLKMNDQLNKEIKEKMDRMFSLFTKLKSDVYIKFENLGQETLRNSTKIKEISKIVEQTTRYITEINQILTAVLAVSMFSGLQQDNTSHDSSFNNTSEVMAQGYKVASILQGWVLEIQDKNKAKYRGEVLNQKSLMQLCLEHLIKYTDRLKGGIMENGKEVFSRISSSSQEYMKTRKRSISRKRNRMSELPKVYR